MMAPLIVIHAAIGNQLPGPAGVPAKTLSKSPVILTRSDIISAALMKPTFAPPIAVADAV